MRKVIVTCCVSALASLAVLVPAGSAQAWSHSGASPFCYGGSDYLTLHPGEKCGFWPEHTAGFNVWYKKVGGGSSGAIIGAITNSSGQAICDNNQVGNCWVSNPASYSYGVLHRDVNNAFDSVYGYATIINYSNATFQMGTSGRQIEGTYKCGFVWLDVKARGCVWYYW